ncbi:MAG TPA: Fur family transcriptional regulator [Dermatophilaceae bacterium]|nr:Fur family transcriptional regulator [Dermatophilaceae bacterium]
MTTTTRKLTRQQTAVLEALQSGADFVSAQDLHARMREQGTTIGLATVYRALTTLAADGAVDSLRTDDGQSVYRQCSSGHHHHLVCRVCGRTVEVDGPAVETWAERVSAQHGYRDVRHTLEIVGTCPTC